METQETSDLNLAQLMEMLSPRVDEGPGACVGCGSSRTRVSTWGEVKMPLCAEHLALMSFDLGGWHG